MKEPSKHHGKRSCSPMEIQRSLASGSRPTRKQANLTPRRLLDNSSRCNGIASHGMISSKRPIQIDCDTLNTILSHMRKRIGLAWATAVLELRASMFVGGGVASLLAC